MAIVEDAATVLEEFVQDVANLPAEIAHLLEEIEAKDRSMVECKQIINARDSSIQKHVKTSGCTNPNPKEEGYVKLVVSNYDRAQLVQEEKVALADKARVLLDRQIKRLDMKIRDLQTEGIIPPDPLLPSLLHPTPGNRIGPVSSSTTGTSTPLQSIPGNAAHTSSSITNAALSRLVPPTSSSSLPRRPSPANQIATPTTSSSLNPLASANRAARESSLDSNKRRKLNVPTGGSGLRQSSLGPGTPKSGTPGLGAGRAGSAGPRYGANKKLPAKKVAPHIRLEELNPAAAASNGGTKKSLNKASGRKSNKKTTGLKTSPSDTGDDSALSEVDGSEAEHSKRHSTTSQAKNQDVEMQFELANGERARGEEEDEDEDMEGDGDDRKYCTCRNVSYGDMVGCDNPDCKYEWFHWKCVGITEEPKGAWFCPTCRANGADTSAAAA